MSRRLRGFLMALVGLAALVGLGLVLVAVFGTPGRVPVAQAPYPLGTSPPASKIPETPEPTKTPGPYPPIYPTMPPRPTDTPRPTLEPPPPPPTPWPTPVITPIPLAQPPYVPEAVGMVTQPYRIFLRDGNRIWVMNHDGTGKRLVADTAEKAGLYVGVTPYLEDRVHWGSVSPDGKRLALELSEDPQAWTRKQPFYTGIYILEVETGELRLLAKDAREPVWAPDSHRVAYRSYQDKSRGLWVANVTTEEKWRVFATADEDESVADFTWSPDGQRIAFCKVYGLHDWANPAVLMIGAEGKGEAIALIPATGYDFSLSRPQWSPDGKSILYNSELGTRLGPTRGYNVWVMNADGSEQRQLTQGMTVICEQWSPDGQWITLVAIRHYEKPQSPYDLWLMHPDGESLQRLTEDPANVRAAQWSPDGTQIVVSREGQGIWTLDLASGAWKQTCSENVDFAVVQ